jgi:hypothetical protein
VLLTCDGGNVGGVVAMDAKGRAREIAKLDDGPNPIAAVTRGAGPRAGLYVVDTLSKNLYFLPQAQLAPYVGKVIVGSELKAHFWVLEPSGNGFKATRIATNLRGGKYNLEGGRILP